MRACSVEELTGANRSVTVEFRGRDRQRLEPTWSGGMGRRSLLQAVSPSRLST